MRLGFKRLMIYYGIALALFTTIGTLFFSIYSYRNFQQELLLTQDYAISQTTTLFNENLNVANNISDYVSENGEHIDNIRQYLQSSPAKYASFTLDQTDRTGEYFNWPMTSQLFYIKHPNMEKLVVTFFNQYSAFKAEKGNGGYKTSAKKALSNDLIYSPIVDPRIQSAVGLVGTSFKKEVLLNKFRNINNHKYLSMLIVNTDERILYKYFGKSVTKEQRNHIKNIVSKGHLNFSPHEYLIRSSWIDDDYRIITLIPKNVSLTASLNRILPIALSGILVEVLLVVIFVFTFKSYRRQLDAIIKTTRQVSENHLNVSVSSDNLVYDDLADLSANIDSMLDAIKRYINEVYQIKILQQETQMKALQSQINPHFMANTLEYIRMAALDIGARDLAKVVYNFAALLRGNVDNKVMSTLKQEVDLVKNYIYLYQVRFPDKLAYQIKFDPQISQIEIPRFSLQPIVENYFVHGVDFTNAMNAIEINARKIENRIVIDIIDNGHPMSEERLQEINSYFTTDEIVANSVGLRNVYLRMANYTKNFEMKIANNQYDGVTVTMSFDV